MTTTYETIRCDVTDGVATVTLDRPDRRNAWTPQMASETNDAFRRLDADDDVRVVVVTGAGTSFCSGADLGGSDAFASDDGYRDPLYWRELVAPWSMRKPVVAAVNGNAVGVGLTFALQCDLRFVAADAKLAFSFVRRGVLPELASHVILPRLVGVERAADLLLSGRTFSGTEAAAMGLALEALPADDVLPAACSWARDVATNAAPVSVALSKRLLWEGLTSSVAEMVRREQELLPWICNQPDAVEGVTAFFEKRPPQWTLGASRDLPQWPTP
ncbi:MAG: Enoyl-CoA hydratase/isomerase [Actinomycetia bacterium]|nr:Enoyl-CoA hydratase/isomerase [Actinomycetes bacterium]